MSDMRAAIWARVSTGDQDTDNQLVRLRDWARQRGFEVVREYVLEESAYNGKHQRQMQQALDDARMGAYDVLLVWALDRLSREGAEAMLREVRRFSERGVRVLSLQEPWTDTVGESYEVMLAIVGWVARMESKRRGERVKAGLARRKAAGLPVGRQVGSRDRKPRKRSGYYRRWEQEREATG